MSQTLAPKAAFPAAPELLSSDLSPFKSCGLGPQTSTVEVAPVQGQSCAQALRLTSFVPAKNFWDIDRGAYEAGLPALGWPVAIHKAIIAEFRFRGATGEADEFVKSAICARPGSTWAVGRFVM